MTRRYFLQIAMRFLWRREKASRRKKIRYDLTTMKSLNLYKKKPISKNTRILSLYVNIPAESFDPRRNRVESTEVTSSTSGRSKLWAAPCNYSKVGDCHSSDRGYERCGSVYDTCLSVCDPQLLLHYRSLQDDCSPTYDRVFSTEDVDRGFAFELTKPCAMLTSKSRWLEVLQVKPPETQAAAVLLVNLRILSNSKDQMRQSTAFPAIRQAMLRGSRFLAEELQYEPNLHKDELGKEINTILAAISVADDYIGDSALVDLFRLLVKMPPIVTAATLGSLTILSIEASLRLLSVLSPDFPVESVPSLMRMASPQSRITLDSIFEAFATSLRKLPVTTVFEFYAKIMRLPKIKFNVHEYFVGQILTPYVEKMRVQQGKNLSPLAPEFFPSIMP